MILISSTFISKNSNKSLKVLVDENGRLHLIGEKDIKKEFLKSLNELLDDSTKELPIKHNAFLISLEQNKLKERTKYPEGFEVCNNWILNKCLQLTKFKKTLNNRYLNKYGALFDWKLDATEEKIKNNIWLPEEFLIRKCWFKKIIKNLAKFKLIEGSFDVDINYDKPLETLVALIEEFHSVLKKWPNVFNSQYIKFLMPEDPKIIATEPYAIRINRLFGVKVPVKFKNNVINVDKKFVSSYKYINLYFVLNAQCGVSIFNGKTLLFKSSNNKNSFLTKNPFAKHIIWKLFASIAATKYLDDLIDYYKQNNRPINSYKKSNLYKILMEYDGDSVIKVIHSLKEGPVKAGLIGNADQSLNLELFLTEKSFTLFKLFRKKIAELADLQ